MICGRNCLADRTGGEKGYCGESAQVKLASAGIHFGEEPLLIGNSGSGTLFFTGCTMKCPFCQNWQISHNGMGRNIDKDTFFLLCKELISEGAENINIVTAGHFAPSITEWLSEFKKENNSIPVLWNSSGFDRQEELKNLTGVVDIFLPDLKTLNPVFSEHYFRTSRYPETVKKGLLYLAEEKPLQYSDRGLLKQGVIVRHLVMPGEIDNTREVLEWYAENLKEKTILSVMTQYTPVTIPGNKIKIPNRALTYREYNEVLSLLDFFNIEDGFIQELDPGDEWLPDFSKVNPFSSDLSKTIWNWQYGFKNPEHFSCSCK